METYPTINMEETGKRIKELRLKAGYSVKDIQKKFNFGTPQAIYKWEQGATLPSLENLAVLSILFKVTIDHIIVIEYEPASSKAK